jgi:hypothetical protein
MELKDVYVVPRHAKLASSATGKVVHRLNRWEWGPTTACGTKIHAPYFDIHGEYVDHARYYDFAVFYEERPSYRPVCKLCAKRLAKSGGTGAWDDAPLQAV